MDAASPQSPPPPAPAVRVQGLGRSFRVGLGLRRRPALVDLDFELPRGETIALVGPNGSGKSTLLRVLAGVDEPSCGALEVLGSSPRSARSRLAYLPEGSPFPAELSALANLELLGSLHGMRRGETRERALPLLETVGLAERARAPLRTYSKGMLRRFGLAQAFLTDPELILLDEPTAGLDAPGFLVLDQLLDGARRRGATVVLASHILSDIHDRCGHLLLLLGGKVAAQGSPRELLAVEGRTTLELEGLDAAGQNELRGWLEEQGAEVLRMLPAARSLLELYRGAEGDAGSRGGHA